MTLLSFDLRDTHRGAAFLKVSEDARRALDRVLDGPLSGRREASDVAISKAGTAWRNARALLDDIPGAISPLTDEFAAIYSNRELRAEAMQQRINAAVAQAKESVAATSADILTRLDRMVSILQAAATPPRPGETAADEGRIANAKSDLRMILDPLPADPMDLGKRMAELLGRAVTTGDRHTAWILGGTTWPYDYVTSRHPRSGQSTITQALDATLGLALDDANGGDFSQARTAYRVAQSSAYAIRVAIGQLPGLIEDVREWTAGHAPQSALRRVTATTW